MNNSPDAAKAQIVDRLRAANNILVTVSANPTVDQLAACIGTALLLDKFKKNTTAVFSGKVPAFLDFLQPGQRLEKTTDALRDFIISLDKSKADKLRYKVEDDVVKIFITPYRTAITENDLKYSAGDFNIDVILALGVQHQQDLDRAITAHGRIFHDAVTLSINNAPGGDFGVVNWEDLEVSSLSELVANLAEALDPNLLDAQIATALLTGIVAETSRFSNAKTRPSTMTVSSKLLQAGANQQLVNQELQDLIGEVVNLAAGTEIAPTVRPGEETDDNKSYEEELVVDENGQIKPLDDAGALPAAAGNTKAPDADAKDAAPAQAAAPAKAERDDKGDDSSGNAGKDAAKIAAPGAEDGDGASGNNSEPLEPAKPAEAAGGEPADLELPSTVAEPAAAKASADTPSVTPEVISDGGNDDPAHHTLGEDAEAARRAVEDALGADTPAAAVSPDATGFVQPELALPQSPPMAPPAPGVQVPPISPVAPMPPPGPGNAMAGGMPLSMPQQAIIQPTMPPPAAGAGSFTIPPPAPVQLAPSPYGPPPLSNEPAPLAMSPADQAFTMPIPPPGFTPPSPPPTAPPAGQPGAAVPPPVPPPITPPTFGV